jgi:hypothetical protein
MNVLPQLRRAKAAPLSWEDVAGIGRVESDNGQTWGSAARITGNGTLFPSIYGIPLNGSNGAPRTESPRTKAPAKPHTAAPPTASPATMLSTAALFSQAAGSYSFSLQALAGTSETAAGNGVVDTRDRTGSLVREFGGI